MSERTIFLTALELDNPVELAAYLEEACSGDTTLRQRIEALLHSHEEAGDFLEQPAVEASTIQVEKKDSGRVPEPPRVGRGVDNPLRPGSSRLGMLQELILADLWWGLQDGDANFVKNYLKRFPEIGEDHQGLIDFAQSTPAHVKPGLHEGCTPPPPRHPGLTTEYWQRFPALREQLRRVLEPQVGQAFQVTIPGYEVLDELGRGGMGVVYKARQVTPSRIVALKVMLGGNHSTLDQRRRFRTEAEAIARLSHPGIVQIYEVGDHEGLPYFSLEFCPGGNLHDHLADQPMPLLQAAELLTKLAKAMQAMHQVGIIHRDLKPANVLLSADGQPKIADFGLARLVDAGSRTESGAVVGTPTYMAPEQAGGQGREVGPATDIWALGAILYECLTGTAPFRGTTLLDTLAQVVNAEPIPPRGRNSRVPLDLETICLKCLRKEPSGRYASAGELADDLERFLDGRPVKARPIGVLERTVKWARRRPAAALLSATVLLALVLAGLHLDQRLRIQRIEEVASEQERRHNQEKGQRQLREAFDQLRDAREELLFLTLFVTDGEGDGNRESICQQARAALKAFGVDSAQSSREALRTFERLAPYFRSSQQRQQAAQWCCEILLAWADVTEAREALPLLNLAEDLLRSHRQPVPLALYERRARCLTAVGDTVGARGERAKGDGQTRSTALDHFLFARECYQRGNLVEAIKACEESLKLEDYFAPFYLQGVCHLRQGHWIEANARLTVCIQGRPNFFWLRAQRAAARIGLNDLAGASTDLKVAIPLAISPLAKYFAYLTRGQLAIARKHWEAARDDHLEAVRYQPAGAYEAHLNLAQTYRKLNDPSAALDALDKAIASAPDDASLYYTQARVYLDVRQREMARHTFEKAIYLAGGTRPRWLLRAHVELGYLKHLSHRYHAALAEFDAALEIDSNYAPAYRQRAETLLALGYAKKAGQALDAYLKRAEPDPAIHRARGLIYASLRQNERACEAYTLALIPRRDPDTVAYRGWAYLQVGSLPSAQKDFKEVLDANPRHADALCGRGHIRMLQGDVTAALRDAEQALKYGQQTATLFCNVACIYARAAQHEQRVSPRRARTARLHEDRAAQLVVEAMHLLPDERKQRFWREQLGKEDALRPLLRHPDLVRLARKHGW